MVTVPAPFFTSAYKNVDGVELTDKSYLLTNCYADELGYTVKRPCLASFLDLQLGVNRIVSGLYWWQKNGVAYAVSGQQIFKIEYSTTASKTDMTGTGIPEINTPVTFATDGTNLYAANGGKIFYTDNSAATIYMADGDAPIAVTHVAYLDGYLLANSVGTNRIYRSNVNAPTVWTAGDYFSAAGNSDNITAFTVLNRDIYIFGECSTEIWQNDGTTPFSRVTGGYMDVGCIAPYSVVTSDNNIFWLSNNRRFVSIEQGGVARISTPYDKEIESYSSVSDCRGYRVEIKGRPFLIFTFLSAGKTLVYDIDKKEWAEWNRYNSTNQTNEAWLGYSYAYSPLWGKHLVGTRHDSLITELSSSTYRDVGETVRTQRVTGHIDYGTLRNKRCNQLRIRMKRGSENLTDTPQLMLRWKNNGSNNWSQEVWVDLGDQAETDIVRKLDRLGVYATRQYEITVTDNCPLVYGGVEEDLDLLR